jgi:Tfp pilus assembly protein PilN
VLDPGDMKNQWQHEGPPLETQMAAALGMAITLYPNEVVEQGPNLIEGTLAQLRTPLRPVLIRSLSPLAAVLLVTLTIFILHLWDLRESAAVQAELEELQPVRLRATELRLQLVAADEKLIQLQKLQRKLPRRDWQGLLTRISQSMPEDVWLDRLSVHDGHLAGLGGASYSESGVYDFMLYLKKVPDVADVALEGTGLGQNDTGPTTTFDLKAILADLNAGKDKGKSNE